MYSDLMEFRVLPKIVVLMFERLNYPLKSCEAGVYV